MAKSMDIGVGGVSRSVKAGYFGVNGVARAFIPEEKNSYEGSNVYSVNQITINESAEGGWSYAYGNYRYIEYANSIKINASGAVELANPVTIANTKATNAAAILPGKYFSTNGVSTDIKKAVTASLDSDELYVSAKSIFSTISLLNYGVNSGSASYAGYTLCDDGLYRKNVTM